MFCEFAKFICGNMKKSNSQKGLYVFYKIGIVLILGLSNFAFSSEAVPAGKIKELSYRGGYLTFKIVSDSGVNSCEACPTDPGNRSSRKCWISEDKSVQVSMLLFAQARDKKIFGRVGQFTTVCDVYQMSIDD